MPDITRALKVNGPEGSYNTPTSSIRNLYNAAATTQAEDYDKIMGGYDSLQQNARTRTNQGYIPLSPQFQQYSPNYSYSRSADLGKNISGLQNFADTGGYSEGDISNIRERGISPIRSIYANAQNNLRRQKVLSGGYSPNYGAVSAKLARDSSSQIGDITTKVNADIAQMIASGKLAGLNSLSPVLGHENDAINNARNQNETAKLENERYNTDQVNKTNVLNKQLESQNTEQNTNDELNAVHGKQSLYGTTPALTNMFAQQVLANNQQNMQAVQTANAIKNQRSQIGLNLVNSQLGTPRFG
jgi:hypothetical protein